MNYRLVAGTINRYQAEEGWENVHIDISPRPIWHPGLQMSVLPEFVGDISLRSSMAVFRDEMFTEIRAHHVLEHLPLGGDGEPEAFGALVALREFYRVLEPGGTLDIEVPDIDRVIAAYQSGELDHAGLVQWCYGEQLANHEPGDSHRYAWTESLLAVELYDAGFSNLAPIDAGHACRFRCEKLS